MLLKPSPNTEEHEPKRLRSHADGAPGPNAGMRSGDGSAQETIDDNNRPTDPTNAGRMTNQTFDETNCQENGSALRFNKMEHFFHQKKKIAGNGQVESSTPL